jgi:hypothetical protein
MSQWDVTLARGRLPSSDVIPHKVLDAIFFLDHMARFSWAF